MSTPARPKASHPSLDHLPALTVLLLVVAVAIAMVPLAELLGASSGVLVGLDPFIALATVLLGFLVVTVSLHTLDGAEQTRSNVLVMGFGLAAACNFLHVVLAYTVADTALARNNEVSLWISTWAHAAEAVCLSLVAWRVVLPGHSKAWLVAAVGLALGAVALSLSGFPRTLSSISHGAGINVVALILSALFCAAAWKLWTTARQSDAERQRMFFWSALFFAAAEVSQVFPQFLGAYELLVGHGLRLVAYALLYQAVFNAGIRMPYLRVHKAERRMRESETRLSLMGGNLPHSVLGQLVRLSNRHLKFLHMGDAIERLNGVTVHEVLADARVLLRQVLVDDIARLRGAFETSFRDMSNLQVVYRIRRADGQIRWMHVSASPRPYDGDGMLWDGVQTDITAHHQAEAAMHAHDALMANMLRQVPGGVARFDRDLRVAYINDQQAQWLNQHPSALQGSLLHEVLPRKLMERFRPQFAKALAGETTVFESSIDGPGGEQVRHTTLVPELNAAKDVVAVLMFAYDLTELKRVERELEHQKGHLARIVEAMPDMVFMKDVHGVYLSVNPVFERYIGRSQRKIIGMTDYELAERSEAVRFSQFDEEAMSTGQAIVYEETLTFADNGYCGQFETIKTPIRDHEGDVVGVLGVCRDITDRKHAEHEVERLAFYDALTGLPNRRLLLDRLQRSMIACQRSKTLAALLFIDLDNFKDLNDTLGHDMGDQLLSQVAARLVHSVREVDTVARFGGDEFVVMLEALAPDMASAAKQAEIVSDKLLASLNEPFDLNGAQHYSTPSIGVTLFGGERLSVDELLKRADLAMYQAKAAGRNTMRFFDPEMQAAVHARSSLEADLRQGLVRGELLVHYQPVVDHQSTLLGVEALVRWKHPVRGMISPGEFIPLAEQTGLILGVGQLVMDTACRQLARWSQSPATSHLSISVNVSARQFRQASFVSDVILTLNSHGANPARLKLELTESLLLGDVEDTIVRMQQLKDEGVGFALDDFGTGYSSLSYLKRLPLEQVKIDQSFVRDVLGDPNDAAIVRTILALAESLDLEVVAEGVETTGQLTFLRLHGCRRYQGYLFGKPMPIDELEATQHLPQPVETVAEGVS